MLAENQTIKKDMTDLQYSIKGLKLRAQRAESEQRVEVVYKDRIETKYELKCNVCVRSDYEKKRAEYKALKELARSKKYAHETFIGFLLLYCFVATIFSAIRTSSIFADFSPFISSIVNFLTNTFKMAKWGIIRASKLGDMIPQPIVAVIVHWLIIIILTVILIGLILGSVYFGARLYFEICVKPLNDNFTYGFALVSLATLVCFADRIGSFLGFNLVWLYIFTILLYFGLRTAILKGLEFIETSRGW